MGSAVLCGKCGDHVICRCEVGLVGWGVCGDVVGVRQWIVSAGLRDDKWYVHQLGIHSLHPAYGQCLMKT